MKFSTVDELRSHLWTTLGLDHRSITFHTIDACDDHLYIRPGIMTTQDDFTDSDGLYDIGTAFYLDPTVYIPGVTSYMIGSGESDHASYDDCEALEDIAETEPSLFDDFLGSDADMLCSLGDFIIENPAYDPDEDDEDDGEWSWLDAPQSFCTT